MIWRWSLNLSVSSVNGYDSLYFTLHLCFIWNDSICWLSISPPPRFLSNLFFPFSAVDVKSQGGGSRFTWLFLCKSNPEHPDPFKLFFLLICFHWLAFLCWFAFLLLLLLFFFCCCWFDIGYVIKPKPTQEIIVWRDLRGPATRTWLSNVFPCNS